MSDVALITEKTGLTPLVRFRPKLRGEDLQPGSRLLVELEGATDPAGRPRPVVYAVDLF